MRDFRDAKAMAKSLREELGRKGVMLSHAECLELVARALGAKDWNLLSSVIQTARAPLAQTGATASSGWSGPVLLLRDFVIFPKQTAPLYIGRETSKQALALAQKGELEVLLIVQRNPADDDPSPAAVCEIGVLADILQRVAMEEAGGIKLLVRGRQRAAVIELTNVGGVRRARAELIPDEATEGCGYEALVRSAAQRLLAYAAQNEAVPEAVKNWLPDITHPGRLADVIAQYAPATVAEKQAILEVVDGVARLEKAALMFGEADVKAA